MLHLAMRTSFGAFVLFVSTLVVDAQTVTGLQGQYRAGQTFLTWNELDGPGRRYRVYRSETPIRTTADLNLAFELGEVDDRSSDNRPRSATTPGGNVNWIIENGGPQLADNRGLYVHTVWNTGTVNGHYAVTVVQNGVETRSIVPGQNTATVSGELASPPQPVLQERRGATEVWAHWTSHVNTPFEPALSLLPSHGHNFLWDPGTTPGPRGLLVRLHAAGQTYAIGWPHRFEVAADVDILALSDTFPGGAWTLWIGAQDNYPQPTADPASQVHLMTLRRVMWTVDRMVAQLGASHDPDRLYAVGGSMGAMGSYYLATEYPDRFAAILARNANFDMTAADINNKLFVETLLGSTALNLTIAAGVPSAGLRTYDRLNAGARPPFPPGAPGPVIRTINGRNDTTVGWSSAPTLYNALAAVHQPAVHYFDERSHNPFGFWRGAERALLARTFSTHRDRPSLHFSGLTLDDNAGSGPSTAGDPVGCLNCYVDYDLETAVSDVLSCQFDVYLRNEGALDDAPAATAQVVLTPGRTGSFALQPGTAVMFTLSEGTALIDSQVLIADGNGRIHTSPVQVSLARRRARFERLDDPPVVPRIDSFTASNTLVDPGAAVTLAWTTTDATSASLAPGIGAVAVDGSRVVNPNQTTTYTLSASGSGVTTTASITVSVVGDDGPAAPTIDTFSASPLSITEGETTRLSWSTTGATSVSITGLGGVPVDGSRTVSPTATTSYVLTATGQGGSSTSMVTVEVTPPAGPVLDVAISGLPASMRNDSTMTVTVANSGSLASGPLTVDVRVAGSGEIELRDPRDSSQTMTSVAPGASRSVSWLVKAKGGGNVTLTVDVSSGAELLGTTSHTLTIED